MAAEYAPEVPGYRFESKIAEGGMGVVYRAVDETLGRTVAVKMIRHDLLGPGDERTDTVTRFLREARVAAQIQSNHVAHVLQFGQTDSGDLFLVLEYLSGKTLADVIRSEKHVNVQRAVRIMRQVCRGMEAAHRLGIVHRDLKPSNIMLIEQDGEKDYAKILDFGVAKIMGDQESGVTRSGMLVGTYTCMAPEQVNQDIIDARTDIYALAVMLFRMIAGRPLFSGNDFATVLYHHVHTQAPSLSERAGHIHIPVALEELVSRCLAKNPNQRVQSMAELDRLLGESVAGQTEMITVNASAKTELHDTQQKGVRTLLDRLAPPTEEDEGLSAAFLSGPGQSVATRSAFATLKAHAQAQSADIHVDDEAETRSAAFSLRGYEAFAHPGENVEASHGSLPQHSSSPPPPPASTEEHSRSELQNRFRHLPHSVLDPARSAPGEQGAVELRRRRMPLFAALMICLGVVVTALSGVLDVGTKEQAIPSSATPTPVQQVYAATPEPGGATEKNAASSSVARVNEPHRIAPALETTVSVPENEAVQPVASSAATTAVMQTDGVMGDGVGQSVGRAVSPSTKTVRDAKKSKKKRKVKQRRRMSSSQKSSLKRPDPTKAEPVTDAVPPSTNETRRPSFIRVRTGNE